MSLVKKDSGLKNKTIDTIEQKLGRQGHRRLSKDAWHANFAIVFREWWKELERGVQTKQMGKSTAKKKGRS